MPSKRHSGGDGRGADDHDMHRAAIFASRRSRCASARAGAAAMPRPSRRGLCVHRRGCRWSGALAVWGMRRRLPWQRWFSSNFLMGAAQSPPRPPEHRTIARIFNTNSYFILTPELRGNPVEIQNLCFASLCLQLPLPALAASVLATRLASTAPLYPPRLD